MFSIHTVHVLRTCILQLPNVLCLLVITVCTQINTGYKGTVTFRLFANPHLIVVFSLHNLLLITHIMCVHYMGCTLWQNANLQTNNFRTNLVCFLEAFTVVWLIFRLMFSLHNLKPIMETCFCCHSTGEMN